MKGKLAFIVGGAVGYVAGTAAGRQRFEQIKGQAERVWNDPAVQDKVDQATSVAADAATQAKDKIKETAASTRSGSGPDVTTPGTSTTGAHA